MEKWTKPTPQEREEMAAADAALETARRESGRILPRLTLHAHLSAQSEDNLFTGLTENISEGGVFVATLSPPSVGQRIQLKLSLDESDDFEVDGEVRWIRYDDQGDATGCGVQFVDLTEDDVQRLRKVMLALPQDPLFTDF